MPQSHDSPSAGRRRIIEDPSPENKARCDGLVYLKDAYGRDHVGICEKQLADPSHRHRTVILEEDGVRQRIPEASPYFDTFPSESILRGRLEKIARAWKQDQLDRAAEAEQARKEGREGPSLEPALLAELPGVLRPLLPKTQAGMDELKPLFEKIRLCRREVERLCPAASMPKAPNPFGTWDRRFRAKVEAWRQHRLDVTLAVQAKVFKKQTRIGGPTYEDIVNAITPSF